MDEKQGLQIFLDELEYQGVEITPAKKEKKLTKTERKFLKTVQSVGKHRRQEIASITRLDPMLKAFFAKGGKHGN